MRTLVLSSEIGSERVGKLIILCSVHCLLCTTPSFQNLEVPVLLINPSISQGTVVPCIEGRPRFGVSPGYSDLQKSPQTAVKFLQEAKRRVQGLSYFKLQLTYAVLKTRKIISIAGIPGFCCYFCFFFRAHNSLSTVVRPLKLGRKT